jgi:hypothetical protein
LIFCKSASGGSNSTTRPDSRTRILSESMTVSRRWAIIMTVHCLNFLLIVACMRASVPKSTFAVASSMMTILTFLYMILTRHKSCLCPVLKFDPPSTIMVSRPDRKSEGMFLSSTSSKALEKCESSNSLKRSKFLRRVPRKRTGSWGMMAILERRSSREIDLESISSMVIDPSKSYRRKRADTMDVFPAPVLPTIPIFSPAWILNETL